MCVSSLFQPSFPPRYRFLEEESSKTDKTGTLTQMDDFSEFKESSVVSHNWLVFRRKRFSSPAKRLDSMPFLPRSGLMICSQGIDPLDWAFAIAVRRGATTEGIVI